MTAPKLTAGQRWVIGQAREIAEADQAAENDITAFVRALGIRPAQDNGAQYAQAFGHTIACLRHLLDVADELAGGAR